MSSRLYDYILTVADASPFVNGNNLIGVTTNTYGIIANVDTTTNNIKVRVSNTLQEYQIGESLVSNHALLSNVVSTQNFSAAASITLTGATVPRFTHELTIFENREYIHDTNWSLNGAVVTFDANAIPTGSIEVRRETGNLASQSFMESFSHLGNIQQSSTTSVTAITSNPFIRETYKLQQNPIVRLIDFYYPGEWYPPNKNGNPAAEGAGLPWPTDIPWRIAEVVGDIHSDIQYNVTFSGESYLPYPLEVDGIETSSDGRINQISIRVSNFDGVVTAFVENPSLVGNVTSNSAQGIVNGELVYGLDPRTVVGNVHYDQTVVDSFYPGPNSAWTKSEADKLNETFKPLKYDSRDFLGGVVEIKSTFANHLRYWPEYSVVDYIRGNTIEMLNSAPYRVGDTLQANSDTSNTVTIVEIEDNGRTVFLNSPFPILRTGDKVFIVNDDYDPEAYVKDIFKVTALAGLNETAAEFSLTSWLQYFKLRLPKRKFYRNTCQWEYKGVECQYPGPGGLPIPNTIPVKTSNANPIDTNNDVAVSADDDDCSKSYIACKIRNNTVHFGGFPGTGRQLPRQ